MDGKILIGTSGTSYSFVNDTRVIALNLLRSPILSGEIEKVFFVYNETQKVVYYAPDSSLSRLSVSADNTLTIDASLPTLVTGDKLKILVWQEDLTIDNNLHIVKVINQIQAELPPTSPRTAEISDANLTAGIYFYSLMAESYRHFILQLTITATAQDAFLKIYKTLDTSASEPATNGTPSSAWVDCTSEKFGISEVIINAGIPLVFYDNLNMIDDKKLDMPDRYLIALRTLNNTWSITGHVRQF